jgi:predicted Zn-dependent protease
MIDLAEGDVASAERAWPGLWQEALATKGLHQWLMAGRLASARAEIALALGRAEAAAEAAREAIGLAERHARLKYQVASRLTLGCALLEMGRATDGTAELRRALAGAERLRHPPSTWRVAASLATALSATGDDEGAEAAHAQLTATVDDFATALSEPRRARFLGAPQLTQALAMGR